jgi:hypothetical protein
MRIAIEDAESSTVIGNNEFGPTITITPETYEKLCRMTDTQWEIFQKIIRQSFEILNFRGTP